MAIDKRAMAMALATAIAIPAEGLRQYAYYDPPGILTVCYGHTGADVVKGKKFNMDACKALLNQDMTAAIDTVERCVPGLPVETLAAFGDAVYNLGPKIVCNTKQSTAARYLQAGKVRAACEQLPRWDKASVLGVMVALPGLTKRRATEREMCLAGVNHV